MSLTVRMALGLLYRLGNVPAVSSVGKHRDDDPRLS